MRKIFIALLIIVLSLVSTATFAEFIINNDGTVSDTEIGLMWEQSDNIQPTTWINASNIAKESTFAGYDDWRLPNMEEFSRLFEMGKPCPSVKSSFTNRNIKCYWSSDKSAQYPAKAYYSCFDFGGMGSNYEDIVFNKGVWLVRGSCSCDGNRFTDTGTTIKDALTGLEWQKDTSTVLYKWQAAKVAVEALVLNGSSDWRLPTLEEMYSIADFSRYNPSLKSVFPISSKRYWTSDLSVTYPTRAWLVEIGYFRVTINDVNYYTRNFIAVRQYGSPSAKITCIAPSNTHSPIVQTIDPAYNTENNNNVTDSVSNSAVSCEFTKENVETAYSIGFTDGRSAGYDAGFESGKTVGKVEGFNLGKDEGKSEGYKSGYDVGKSDGKTEGYNLGYDVGKTEGYTLGLSDSETKYKSIWMAEGGSIGYELGYDDGYAVCTKDSEEFPIEEEPVMDGLLLISSQLKVRISNDNSSADRDSVDLTIEFTTTKSIIDIAKDGIDITVSRIRAYIPPGSFKLLVTHKYSFSGSNVESTLLELRGNNGFNKYRLTFKMNGKLPKDLTTQARTVLKIGNTIHLATYLKLD
ncbi:MAG: DUF1566 domain-containing protein [Desulfobacterales bacterium]|nr:DUF1566 domain-containing protein [Desulfobacterales bacterium]